MCRKNRVVPTITTRYLQSSGPRGFTAIPLSASRHQFSSSTNRMLRTSAFSAKTILSFNKSSRVFFVGHSRDRFKLIYHTKTVRVKGLGPSTRHRPKSAILLRNVSKAFSAPSLRKVSPGGVGCARHPHHKKKGHQIQTSRSVSVADISASRRLPSLHPKRQCSTVRS